MTRRWFAVAAAISLAAVGTGADGHRQILRDRGHGRLFSRTIVNGCIDGGLQGHLKGEIERLDLL
jgi:hypothetical protein